ncbi:hypothetical protein [Kribbella sp. NPDC050470]|uniref:hypothetical protein n=1 Tax=unclassified Kribbella TaxID=2644121 RepID=UPI0037B7756F
MRTYRLVNGPLAGDKVTAQPDKDQVVARDPINPSIVYVASGNQDEDGTEQAHMLYD